jgi:hypothetical protein
MRLFKEKAKAKAMGQPLNDSQIRRGTHVALNEMSVRLPSKSSSRAHPHFMVRRLGL